MTSSGYDLTCGYLVVPEDRRQPDGRQVKLPVVVFHTQHPDPQPDPVIYLAGGGGFNMLPLIPFYLQLFGDRMLQDRDLVFYNQRGAPLTKPALPRIRPTALRPRPGRRRQCRGQDGRKDRLLGRLS
jgi:hypothetical protein